MPASHTSLHPSCPYSVRLLPALALAVLLSVSAWTSDGYAMGSRQGTYTAGMQTFGFWDEHIGERFDFVVFYPARTSPKSLVRDGWRIEAHEGARIAPGFYPLILLSHDTASSRFANSDLAAALARSGFMVISPTHSGDSQTDSSSLYLAESMAARPRQLLLSMETVLASAKFAPHADESRIGLLGVGFGAVTAMQLAGALPDPGRVEEYCKYRAPDSEEDPFCNAWVRPRLAAMAAEMATLQEANGPRYFLPALDHYAPALIRVAVEAGADDSGSTPPPPEPSLWQRLFGSDEDPQETEGGIPENVAASRLPVFNGTLPLDAPDFDGGPLFGNTDSGRSYIHLELPEAEEEPGSPENVNTHNLTSPALQAQSQVYLRPASSRRILSAALMVPAGGMLFEREGLSAVRLPAVIIEAEKDELYAPEGHARPYFSLLPSGPQLLRLPESDHFSVFAPCAQDVLEKLDAACGRIPEEDRDTLYSRRDDLLISFFQSTLGGPGVSPGATGWVAAPDPGPETQDNQGSE